MNVDGKFVARVALFSALAYVLALASFYIPNVSLIFIAVFACGALFGGKTGVAAGGLGMFLWTVFNPFGMAPLPVTIAQIIGMIIVGALLSGLTFQVIVSGVSAWLFGPFWASLSAGLLFMLVTIISNAVIFPACYPLVVKLAARERY
jgi:hypothetical protein